MPAAITVIVGPTAAGKSSLAMRLARIRRGELISADSMQVYRGFDIGTGKPTAAEKSEVRHHLVDILDPSDLFSAAHFVALADQAIADILSRGNVPIVVGGTGLYIRALLHGLFEAPPNSPEVRARHEAIRQCDGIEALYRSLQQCDPEAAVRIDANDFVRVSRALEVFELTGQRISQLHREHAFQPDRYKAHIVGIDPGDSLRECIERRVDAMMAAGWMEEVKRLVASGHATTHPMGSLGYRQLNAHLAGTLDLEEAVRQTKRDTRRFARRQRNWFRAENNVVWYDSAVSAAHDGFGI